MRARQVEKQQRRPSASFRHKISSPNLLKAFKDKQREEKRQLIKIPHKTASKASSRQNQKSFKNSLFNSLQELPKRPIEGSNKRTKKLKKQIQPISSYTKIEDTTSSREVKLKTKQYDHPNGQYFGSKHLAHSQNKSNHNARTKVHSNCSKLSKSLEGKIKEFRSIQSMHESESESMKSEISEQEMRRLRKMHSMEKVKLMEEIIGIEEKIIHKKHRV